MGEEVGTRLSAVVDGEVGRDARLLKDDRSKDDL
jgi:hypothetical protein